MKKVCLFHNKTIIVIFAALFLLFVSKMNLYAAATDSMPSRPVISAVNLSSKTSIKVIWKKTKNATKYEVYASTNGGSYKKLKTTSATSFTHHKIKAGYTYSYKVRGVNASKKGRFSSSKKLTVEEERRTANATENLYCIGQKCQLPISYSVKRTYRKISGKSEFNIRDVKLKSNNRKVATVDREGTIKMKGTGRVTISMYYNKQLLMQKKYKVRNHKGTQVTCENPSVCKNCGKKLKEPLAHEYTEATCTEPSICRRCGEKHQDPLEHDFTEVTCTEPSVCRRCGEKHQDPLGHDINVYEGKIIGNKGNLQGIQYSCRRCNAVSMVTGEDVPFKIRLAYRSTMGFEGENAQVLQKVYSILDSIVTDEMTDQEKVKAIHDYLIYHADYYKNYYQDAANGTIPGWVYSIKAIVVNGEGVCNSYALTFYTMAVCEGIPCKFISGIATNSIGDTGGHSWNQVYLGEKWYYIDCTWDDPFGGGGENYSYYLSETLWADHVQQEAKALAEEITYLWQNYYLCGQRY